MQSAQKLKKNNLRFDFARIGTIDSTEIPIEITLHENRPAATGRVGFLWSTSELTDKYSTLRGPPRDTGFLRIPVLILEWFWGAPPVD